MFIAKLGFVSVFTSMCAMCFCFVLLDFGFLIFFMVLFMFCCLTLFVVSMLWLIWISGCVLSHSHYHGVKTFDFCSIVFFVFMSMYILSNTSAFPFVWLLFPVHCVSVLVSYIQWTRYISSQMKIPKKIQWKLILTMNI